MRAKYSKPKISEESFLELLLSTMIIQNQDMIIKRYDLEHKLYDFYDDPDFNFLFVEDICKREMIDDHYVDLDLAFANAVTFGLLTSIHDCGDSRYMISITPETAIKICSRYDSEEVIAMNKLCNSLHKKNDASLVLTKSKKGNLSKHNI